MKKALVIFIVLISMALSTYLYGSVYDLKSKSQSGDRNAQFNLGLKYGNGDGVPKDNSSAYFWVLIAVAFGHNDNYNVLTLMALKLTSLERKLTQNRAVEWIWNNPNYYYSSKSAAVNWIRSHGTNIELMIELLGLNY